MSTTAASHLPEVVQPPPVPPLQVNIVWNDPLAHNSPSDANVLHGTAGKADLFVFDVGAAIAANSTTSFYPNGAPEFVDRIEGFEPVLDQIAFVNVPSDFDYLTLAAGYGGYWGGGDPAIYDGVVQAGGIGGGGVSWVYNVDVVDTAFNPLHVATSYDSTITLIDGHQLTLPPGPWFLA
jgi:hypothetical protein